MFYARLKGVNAANEKMEVTKSLKTVSLGPFKDRLSKGLSGGEKRRLSIAIALVGDPKVVFLDEPTTGLDPEVRRLIWNIINEARAGKTIVLTTHSMEEAEVLCQRIGNPLDYFYLIGRNNGKRNFTLYWTTTQTEAALWNRF
jgi:ABC-type multidrug transport system ATPase subunit